MNTFTDLPASIKSYLNGGNFVTERMVGLQQSSAGGLSSVV